MSNEPTNENPEAWHNGDTSTKPQAPSLAPVDPATMAKAKAVMECDCCHVNHAIGIASSAFAAASFAWCEECLRQRAEPEHTFEYLYWYVGNRGEGLIDLSEWKTFKDGRYWTWTEWKAWADTQPMPEHYLPPDPEPEVVQPDTLQTSAIEKDAMRYRYLRDHIPTQPWELDNWNGLAGVKGDTFDLLVDEAMRMEQSQG